MIDGIPVKDTLITISYGQVVGRARQYPYWQPALYRKYITKSGRVVAKYVQHLGVARRSQKLAQEDAIRLSRGEVPVIIGIRQYKEWPDV